MCGTKNGGWLNWLVLDPTMGWLSNKRYKDAKKKDQKVIDEANQAVQNQIEQNKLANSTQTTENIATTTSDTKNLITQKLPLNTSFTGAALGSSTSVGLNLGGY